jgi:lysophospholipase L1-like esterase
VSIASDSNGYGHVTFQRPDTGEIAITFIDPLAVPLQAHLDALGLNTLQVIDRSLSAGGLTIASSNYLESDQYFRLKRDQCKFVIVTPFFPDVAVNLSRPEDYITNLNWLLDGITRSSPGSQVLVLNFYLPHRAEFTADNSGKGLTKERIDAFNQALAAACADGGMVHAYNRVVCVDIRGYFEDMQISYVLAETTKADYDAALYRTNGYTHVIDDYFAASPDGVLIGDGIHLGLAGRDRLAERLADLLAQLNRDF